MDNNDDEEVNNERKAKVFKQGIVKLQGKDYLQVAHRIVIAREDHPEWRIETSFESYTFNEQPVLVARCVISDSTGVLSTATKTVRSEGRGPAAKYPMEMAETGAIGRCLGLCGYGTLSGDLSEGDQIADAPVTKKVW